MGDAILRVNSTVEKTPSKTNEEVKSVVEMRKPSASFRMRSWFSPSWT
jgi:hypothetical protein